MLGLWARWSLRDLRRRWLLVTTIALVLALGTGTYAALAGTSEWRRQSNDASFAVTHLHDLRVTLASGTTAQEGRLARTVRSIPSAGDLGRVRERLVVPTQVSVRTRTGRVVVPAEVVGHQEIAGATVDAVDLTAGRLPAAGEAAAVVERLFADYYRLPDTGTLSLPGGRPLRWVGLGAAPEEFLVTGRGGTALLGEASFATLYTTLPVAQSLSPRLAGQVNDVVLTLRAGADRREVRRELEHAFATARPSLSVDVLTRADSPAYRILYQDIEGDEKIWTVVAGLVLLGAVFAAVNLTSRVVEAQRREIGIGMALGVRPPMLAVRPMLLGVQIAVLGTLLGIAVALAIGAPLADLYRSVLPLPVWRTPFQVWPFVRASVVGLLVPLVAVAVPVTRAVSVEPVEAIRVGHLTARSSALLGVSGRLRLPGRGYRAMPLRNLLRTPRRTVLTALAVAAAITTLVAVGGLLDSFRAAIVAGETELSRGAPHRLVVTLDRWYPSGSAVVREVLDRPQVGREVAGVQVPMSARRGRSHLPLLTEVVPRHSLWRLHVTDGSWHGGLVLAEKAAADLGVSVGDRVAVRYPRPTAGGARTEVRRLPVAGLHANPLRVLAYVDQREADAFGLGGVVNRLQLLPAPGVSRSELRNALFELPAVATVEDVQSTSRLFDEALEQFVGVLLIMGGAVMLLALLIAYNSSTIAVDERAREHATMVAFGLPLRSILGMLTVENVVLGVLGSLLGLAGGLGVVTWMTRSILGDTVPDFSIAPALGTTTLAAAFVAGVGAVAVAPLLTMRRLTRLDVPSTLRVVE
jgi:putative ABC transport system permease protein